MTDGGYTFTLLQRNGAHKRSCAAEKDTVPASLKHPAEDISAQNACTAPAARTARMHVLLFGIVNERAAILVNAGNIKAVVAESVDENGFPERGEVARQNQVVVVGTCARIGEKGGYGVIRGRCRAFGYTKNKKSLDLSAC